MIFGRHLMILQLFAILAAASMASAIELQPIVGYEQTQKSYPSPHTESRLIYGARLLVGPKIFSLETEFTTGKDSESFPDQDLTIKETAYNGMLGIRSGVNLGFIDVHLRAGGHLRKRKIETTEDGVLTVEKPATYLSPYAGAGATLGSGPIRGTAGVTAIFIGKPQANDVEYQYTLGIGLGI